MIQLDNYEAGLSYFPLEWNYSGFSTFRIGNMTTGSCVSWVAGNVADDPLPIDLVCVLKEPGTSDSLVCMTELMDNLTKFYQLTFTDSVGNVVLYRLE